LPQSIVDGEGVMTRTACGAIGLVLAAAIGIAAVGAEESEQPQATFFAPLDVPLISVEVYASDSAGRPMPGLTLEDFEIFEDGKQVSISHFYAAPGFGKTTPEEVDSGDDLAVSAPAQDLYLVIYFDDTNLSRGRRQSAVEHLRKFLASELPPDLKVMLVRYHGHLNIEQGFTEETDEVIAALDATRDSASLSRRIDQTMLMREIQNAASMASMSGDRSNETLEQSGRSTWQSIGSYVLEQSGRSTWQSIGSYVDQAVHRTRTSIENQKRLIRSLSGLSGRKAILLVSDGVEARPGEALYRAWSQAFGAVPEFRIDARSCRQPATISAASSANSHISPTDTV